MPQLPSLWKKFMHWFEGKVPCEWLRECRGLSESQIRRAEKELGHRLPEDLRESYKIHNGFRRVELVTTYICNLGFLLPLRAPKTRSRGGAQRDVVSCWKSLQRLLDTTFPFEVQPKGPIAKVYWSSDWIPIYDNEQGDYLVADMNPPPLGAVGQIIEFRREFGPCRVFARSFQLWLTQLVTDMEKDRYVVDISSGSIASLIRKSTWRRMCADEKRARAKQRLAE